MGRRRARIYRRGLECVGKALRELAENNDLEELTENIGRFHARLRDKKLLKQIAWKREVTGYGKWQTVRYTRMSGGAA